MHYNPASIALASSTVKSLKPTSVLVESCEKRWERTILKQPRGGLMRLLLDNEMQAASEAHEDSGGTTARLVLGDQAIIDTNKRIKETFKQTLRDLASFRWSDIIDDLRLGYSQAVGITGDDAEFLGLRDFLDPKLMLATPVSLVRYPLALLIKSPIVGLALAGLFTAASLSTGSDDPSSYHTLAEASESIFLTLLEVAILSRTFLIALLQERNVIIADSIVNECQLIKDSGGSGLVGVLGMAHVNGVKKLIVERA
jgi:pheromone shutdown protein TraB